MFSTLNNSKNFECRRENAAQGGRSPTLMRSTQLSTNGVTVSAEAKVTLNDAHKHTHSLHIMGRRRWEGGLCASLFILHCCRLEIARRYKQTGLVHREVHEGTGDS